MFHFREGLNYFKPYLTKRPTGLEKVLKPKASFEKRSHYHTHQIFKILFIGERTASSGLFDWAMQLPKVSLHWDFLL